MTRTILFILLLFIATNLVNGQNQVKIIKWRVNTEGGACIAGVAANEKEVNKIIKDYANRNKGKGYDILYPMVKKLVYCKVSPKISWKMRSDFLDLAEKPYIFLSQTDIATLKIIHSENFEKGIDYYRSIKKKYSRAFAVKHFEKLHPIYQNYIPAEAIKEKDIKITNRL